MSLEHQQSIDGARAVVQLHDRAGAVEVSWPHDDGCTWPLAGGPSINSTDPDELRKAADALRDAAAVLEAHRRATQESSALAGEAVA